MKWLRTKQNDLINLDHVKYITVNDKDHSWCSPEMIIRPYVIQLNYGDGVYHEFSFEKPSERLAVLEQIVCHIGDGFDWCTLNIDCEIVK